MRFPTFALSLLGGVFIVVNPSCADTEYIPTEAEAAKRSLDQARSTVARAVQYCGTQPPPFRVQLLPDVINFLDTATKPPERLIIRLKDMRPIVSFDQYFLSDSGVLKTVLNGNVWGSGGKTYPRFRLTCHDMKNDWPKVLGDSLLRLKQEFDKANNPEDLANFKDEAQRYQTAKPKPELPEEARRFRVQAESAVAGKRFDEAIEKYGQALVLAPWWPEGHFNRAIVLGELQNFDSAINEMKRYLMLKPDAPDARQAQDYIYAWEAYPFEDK